MIGLSGEALKVRGAGPTAGRRRPLGARRPAAGAGSARDALLWSARPPPPDCGCGNDKSRRALRPLSVPLLGVSSPLHVHAGARRALAPGGLANAPLAGRHALMGGGGAFMAGWRHRAARGRPLTV